MRLPSLLTLATLLLAAPVVGRAETATDYSPAYDACLNSAAGQSTYGMLDCGAAELKLQDARLNRAYKARMGDLVENPPAKAALLKAQRAWIAFRDADCATVRAVSGGTIASIYVQSCHLDHTARRARALEVLLQP